VKHLHFTLILQTLRSFSRVPARLGSSDYDMSGAAFKALGRDATRRDAGTTDGAGPSVPATRCKAFKEGLQEKILDPDDIKFTLDNFPYYLRYVLYKQTYT
jgi:hypothetical protein